VGRISMSVVLEEAAEMLTMIPSAL
jgi:hypothetical protein